ncbi:MAG: hypothetical protein A2V46_05080 [Bacteroidetes bacterium RBG_19FT_COMBO_42_7]|nr:MAG: hypothetical protein A2Y71_16390 [Bacteroidetes bacterium RBG_13_42_15]OFY75354.1 MAG: hypothetical protein A2V46_05080 [Bacteroidetes bacterium RBG_19FT_COMBO_42_7]
MPSDFTLDLTNKKILEKYSSAFTLSDMEVFIFPELFYPLVLANIMSPVIWRWREDPWFRDIEKKSFTYKANRIKQFIIQNYVFNLDLSTWGLTTKTREIARFSDFLDLDLLRQSNALFGYEGDKYYFDIDIRKHFGLDKYTTDVIPYWKTETVEAMTAFRYKDNFSTGAGECVSLSALYAATMFIIGRIPLEKIFLIATPLHSQDFIIEKEGLITNNRRIVTRNMWYNGTSLTEKARRALENERITIVSHISGFIHTLYNKATIDKEAYHLFSKKLREFLNTELTDLIFLNFLRFKSKYKTLFQYRCECSGNQRYITLEKMFEYEHTSKYNLSYETRELLVNEIEGDEFHLSPIQGKIMLNDIESIFSEGKRKKLEEFRKEFIKSAGDISGSLLDEMFRDLQDFISIDPKLPEDNKRFISSIHPVISIEDTREKITETILNLAGKSETALLTLFVYRQMDKIDWLPFVKAAVERNPVCFTELNGKSVAEACNILDKMPDESIYDGNRLALPDEVWNFGRGDGIEKAFLLGDFIMQKDPSSSLMIEVRNKQVCLSFNGEDYFFTSSKSFRKSVKISGNNYIVNSLS